MKNRILNLFLIGSIVLSVILSSCSKDDFGDDTTTGDSDTFTDSRDGKTYQWVKIGNQTWMAENLAYTGSGIQHISDDYNWENNTDYDAWCYHENNPQHGVLYQWEAAKRACPEGWHLASFDEWDIMRDYLAENGYSSDGIIGSYSISKSIATDYGWKFTDNPHGVGSIYYPEYQNKSGFSALPNGGRSDLGRFSYELDGSECNNSAYWWTATERISDNTASVVAISYLGNGIGGGSGVPKLFGNAVRCIRD